MATLLVALIGAILFWMTVTGEGTNLLLATCLIFFVYACILFRRAGRTNAGRRRQDS